MELLRLLVDANEDLLGNSVKQTLMIVKESTAKMEEPVKMESTHSDVNASPDLLDVSVKLERIIAKMLAA